VNRFRSSDGQVTILAAVIMAFLVAMVAFVLDIGSWFREQRAAQSTVDAAALAGAQALPLDPAQAMTLANNYADQNGGASGVTVTVGSKWVPNDEITVTADKPAEGFFSKILGITTVTVHAHASAVSELPPEVSGVAPIVVNILHPMLTGAGCGSTTPCYGPSNPTTIPLGSAGAPGAFDLINLDPNDQNGTIGASTIGNWIQNGFTANLPLKDYYSRPGAAWNDSAIQGALLNKNGKELLFPVYDILSGGGSNADYHVIAWVGFHLTGEVAANGSTGSITGYFTRIIRVGIVSSTGPPTNTPDLGVRSVALIN
jgi:Flp pilus assembly protein TadG